MNRIAFVVFLLIVSAAVAVTAAAAPGAGKRSIAYDGKISGQVRERVHFQVIRRKGSNDNALFDADRVDLACHSYFPQIDPDPIRLRFLGPKVFQGQRYEQMADGDWSYYEVKGQLKRGGRAKGYLLYVLNPYDPAGTTPEEECSTGGQLYVTWRAHRAG